jgi:solute:Na+ symporter, SSS family
LGGRGRSKWWRASAWSEIGAMGSAAVLTTALGVLHTAHPASAGDAGWAWLAAVPAGWLKSPSSAGATVVLSLPIWLGLTLLTPPPTAETPRAFADKVCPGSPGWPVALRGDGGPTWPVLGGIAASVITIYGALLGFRWLVLGHVAWAIPALGVAAVAAVGAGYAGRAAAARPAKPAPRRSTPRSATSSTR